MVKRNDAMSVISLFIGLLLLTFGVAFGLRPILLSKTQNGILKVKNCTRVPSSTKTDAVQNRKCYGTFRAADGSEPIAQADSFADINNSADFQPGNEIRVYLSSTGKMFDSKLAIQPYLLAVVFATLFISYSWFLKTSKNAPENTPALTQGFSKWTNPAFFSGLASVLAVPAPIAVVTGLLAVADTYKNKKKGAWRAWTGLVLGIFFTFMFTRLILSIAI